MELSMIVTLNDRFDAPEVARALDEDGYCIVPDVLSGELAATLGRRLREVAADLARSGVATHTPLIDPTPANVRVYDLPEHDPAFLHLLTDDAVCKLVDACLGPDWIVSNFTANIARPGARAMKIHSDMALVFPEPWAERWALNVIWCLDEARADNGATRYLRGSHRFTHHSDVPPHAEATMRPLEAPAGSAIVLDGRTWHSSGNNVTESDERALLFAYYTRGFIRPQVCWHEALSAATIAALEPRQRRLLGFGALSNTFGVSLIARS
jgi:fumagillin biosynthesis dioxygenase